MTQKYYEWDDEAEEDIEKENVILTEEHKWNEWSL